MFFKKKSPNDTSNPHGDMPQLVRLYVISRDNINLEIAQHIVMDAGSKNHLILSRVVPLVWCAAYPDELFGAIKLPGLLVGYAHQQEGDEYLKPDSSILPIEGKYNGYDYYLMALFK